MTIGPFKGEQRWLSNFWPAPVWVNETAYLTNEHYFQAAKTNDFAEKRAIIESPTAGEAKILGSRATLVDNWDEKRFMVMHEINLLKFTQHDCLYHRLMDTGEESLVEFNHWHDNFWGVCTCVKCGGSIGKNVLGQTLMNLRSSLRLMDGRVLALSIQDQNS